MSFALQALIGASIRAAYHWMFAPLIALAVIFPTEPARAWQKTLFMHCKTKSAIKLTADGTFEPDTMAHSIEFTVDVQSGLVRLKYASSPMQWIVLRPGDAENDTVLVGQVDNPSRMTDLVLRIRDWASKPTITFTKSQSTSFTAGVCAQL
jgi:hypothetical protein